MMNTRRQPVGLHPQPFSPRERGACQTQKTRFFLFVVAVVPILGSVGCQSTCHLERELRCRERECREMREQLDQAQGMNMVLGHEMAMTRACPPPCMPVPTIAPFPPTGPTVGPPVVSPDPTIPMPTPMPAPAPPASSVPLPAPPLMPPPVGTQKVMAELPCAPELPYGIKEIVLGRLTGGYDDDRCPGDEGLQVALEPHDFDGHSLKVPGCLSVLALEVSQEGLKRPLCSWEVTPQQLRKTWRGGLLGSGYYVQLPWKTWPTTTKIRVIVQFKMADGRVFEADKDVTIHLQPAAMPHPILESPGLPPGVLPMQQTVRVLKPVP